jgi:hypothetical protein
MHHLDEAWSIMMEMQKYFFEVVVCRRAHVLFMLCVFALLGTQDKEQRQTKQKSLSKKTKKMSNTDHTNTRGRTQVLARVGHFLSLIRHPSCYSYIQDVLECILNLG